MIHSTLPAYVRTLSVDALNRLYTRVMARVYEASAGGLMFGIDWRTLMITMPGYAEALDVIRAEGARRMRRPYVSPFPLS